MSGEALRCAGVGVSYGATVALDGVDLTVAAGEVLAVLGASGSGKSTLLHAVAGLVRPSTGEVWVAGRRVAAPGHSTPPERRHVGLVFQDFALWPHLSAVETVAYPLRRTGHSVAVARARAQALLDRLDIGHLAGRRPAELSGGEQQRVGLARAIARDPRVFLLDEPTSHLDTHVRAAFQECVRDRQAATGAAAVYATHDAGEALALADRVALLVDGRVVQVASPVVVYAEPVSLAAARLTGPCSVLPAGVDVGPGSADGPVLVRPDWVCLGGPLPGRIATVAFRGPHTDYLIDAPVGAVSMRLSGPPSLGVGEPVEWGATRAWVMPTGAQPSAVTAPG